MRHLTQSIVVAAVAVALAACSTTAASEGAPEAQAQVMGHDHGCTGAAGCEQQQAVAGQQTVPGQQVTDPVLADYLNIHRALAADSVVGVADAARRLAQASTAHLAHQGHADVATAIVSAARGLEGATDVATARERFKALSTQVIRYRALNPAVAAQTVVVHCSMANADWVQLAGPVTNPYYGRSMLACGEIIRQQGQV